ncbi:MAG TPA: NAD(P)/FAD-dependent oxidoreductase [Clostridiales bacterium]|nr:NAD(P)/FAD-dependent oxidoreductase [Clostridiales bacterium]
MNYVIIGNSAAAIGCVEGIRQVDKKGKITIISDEPHHTYSRPLISYLLLGKTDEERMKYRSDSFYEDKNVTAMLGVTVTKIDTDKRCVELEGEKPVKYDRLLVATGSRAFIPPMEGLDTVDKKFTFMKLDDAKALEDAINENSRVLIIGAGLIGLKCAEGINDRVQSIEVVDLADRILPSILDETGSAMVQKHIEDNGIKFTLSDSVAQFDKNTATLKSGKVIEFDVLVIAVGVRPNTQLVAQAGGAVNRGIVTDDRCRTTLKNIYSAGDCTESLDITTGQERILALLPNAYMQGETAGIDMAGGQKLYDKAMPMNAIGFFGLHIITAGSYNGEAAVIQSGNSYKKLVTADDTLIGYIMIGDVARAGIYTALIREKKPLSSIDFDLIKEKPQLMAFSKRERAKTLGGLR